VCFPLSSLEVLDSRKALILSLEKPEDLLRRNAPMPVHAYGAVFAVAYWYLFQSCSLDSNNLLRYVPFLPAEKIRI
jgi:hypothetical protein